MVKFPKLTAGGGTCKGTQSSAAVFYWNGDASSVGSEGTGRQKGKKFVERKKVLESPLG